MYRTNHEKANNIFLQILTFAEVTGAWVDTYDRHMRSKEQK